MDIIVPFDPRNPKTRLDVLLNKDERQAFARAMLNDVIEAIHGTGHTPTLLTPTYVETQRADLLIDDRPLTVAVNSLLKSPGQPIAVLMADLPLVTAETCSRLFEATGDVVLARGFGGGTNALVSRHSDFEVDYHGASYLDHLRAAEDCGAAVTEVDSYRLGIDIDEPEDVPEILLHGDGHAWEWLRDAGFQYETCDGRVTARRTDHSTAATVNEP